MEGGELLASYQRIICAKWEGQGYGHVEAYDDEESGETGKSWKL